MKKLIAETRNTVMSILLYENPNLDYNSALDSLFLVSIGEASCNHHFIEIDAINGSWAIGYNETKLPPWISNDELCFSLEDKLPQKACNKCTLGTMDGDNPHLWNKCLCKCHLTNGNDQI